MLGNVFSLMMSMVSHPLMKNLMTTPVLLVQTHHFHCWTSDTSNEEFSYDSNVSGSGSSSDEKMDTLPHCKVKVAV